MTIAEKNKEKIFEIAKDGDKVAVSKTGEIISCFSLSCNNCIGEAHKGLCMGTIKEYLNKEFCTFKEDDLVEVSDNLQDWKIRRFACMTNDETHPYRVYDFGFTSKETAGTSGYKYCRKYGALGGLVKEQE